MGMSRPRPAWPWGSSLARSSRAPPGGTERAHRLGNGVDVDERIALKAVPAPQVRDHPTILSAKRHKRAARLTPLGEAAPERVPDRLEAGRNHPTNHRPNLNPDPGEGRAGAQPELGARSQLPPAARPANRSEAGVASPSISPRSIPRAADRTSRRRGVPWRGERETDEPFARAQHR
jgi:hypothetical protein